MTFQLLKRGLSSSKSSRAWMERHKNDIFVKKSVKHDMRSRSSFKLLEIQEKYKIVKKSNLVIDLGAAPGGWSLACSNIVKSEHNGIVVGVDLLPFHGIENVFPVRGDFRSTDTKDKIRKFTGSRAADVVLSDMLHNTTGDKSRDHFLSVELVQDVLSFITPDDVLKPSGNLLTKYLQGGEEKDLIDEFKERFNNVKLVKPKASRSESKEMYILGMNKKRCD